MYFKFAIVISAPNNLLRLIEASLEQLEVDDTISRAVTDQLVDSLLKAQELYENGQQPWDARPLLGYGGLNVHLLISSIYRESNRNSRVK